jgi:hypothetical protein
MSAREPRTLISRKPFQPTNVGRGPHPILDTAPLATPIRRGPYAERSPGCRLTPVGSSVETTRSTPPRPSHDDARSTEFRVEVPKDPPDLTPATARALLRLIRGVASRPRLSTITRTAQQRPATNTARQCIPRTHVASRGRFDQLAELIVLLNDQHLSHIPARSSREELPPGCGFAVFVFLLVLFAVLALAVHWLFWAGVALVVFAGLAVVAERHGL